MSSKPSSSMELLAPVGSVGAFEAAFSEGADAVYVGAPGFNARSLKRDLSFSDIAGMVDYAHRNEKRVYIAMNSLVKENDVVDALKSLSIFEQMEPDALIVQDLGLFHLAKTYFPSLSLHASTLLSVNNSTAAGFLTKAGFDRVVLARELSLKEMQQIVSKSEAELEVFIHGAMCFSYSGLCLFSSMHGGKSSLRGKCVQPCRRNYQLQSGKKKRSVSSSKKEKGSYFFSMNDLSGVDYLENLKSIGVVSLKIEGRLKSVEYVRKTVRAYKQLLNTLGASEKEKRSAYNEAQRLLEESMGRKRSGGFFVTGNKDVISPHLSGVAGVFLGKTEKRYYIDRAKKGISFQVVLKRDLQAGDRVRFQDERNDLRESFTVKELFLRKKRIQKGIKGQRVSILVPGLVETGQKKELQGLFFLVDIKDRKKRVFSPKRSLGKNKKIVSDDRKVTNIIRDVNWVENISPVKRGGSYETKSYGHKWKKGKINWWVRVENLPSPNHKLPVVAVKLLVPLNKKNVENIASFHQKAVHVWPNLIWELPAIIHENEQQWFAEQIGKLKAKGFTSFQIGHLSQHSFFFNENQNDGFSLYGNYTLNVLNSSTLTIGSEYGLQGMLFSVETDHANLKSTLRSFRLSAEQRRVRTQVGMYVYGKPPLFTSRSTSSHLKTPKKIVSPKGERFVLDQQKAITRVYAEKPLVLLPYIYEMQEFGVDYFVLDIGHDSLYRTSLVINDWLHKGIIPRGALEGNYVKGLA